MPEGTSELEKEKQDLLFANVVRFLIDGQEVDAANVLLSCTVVIADWMMEHPDYGWVPRGDHHVEIKAPRAAYDVLMDNTPERSAVWSAFDAVLNDPDISVKAWTFDNLASDWKERLLAELASGGRPTNQGLLADKSKYFVEWNGLRFRSKTETRIADALDKRAALYFPNCLVRLGKPSERQNVEADFLVFYEGRYGILEVDGGPFHQVAAKDHDRDRLFKEYGILMVERFTADECFENAEGVVTKFLRLLKKT